MAFCLSFRFGMKDIRSFAAHSATLIGSSLPEDWILGVLCMNATDHSIWIHVARKVRDLQGAEEARGRVAAQLLIAATLRKLPHELMKELEMMTAEINIESSPIFLSVFEKGETEQALASVWDIIEISGMVLAQEDANEIAGLELRQIEALRRNLLTTRDVRKSLEMLARAAPDRRV